jgi:AraC family transcriptional regulator
MVRYIVFFVFSGLVVFGITVYFRLGGHKHVSIEQKDISAYTVVGKKHVGAYHKIGPVIFEVEAWAKANNLPCNRTYGEYLDDPRTKDEDRLQSIGGCVLGNVGDPNSELSDEVKKTLPPDFIVSTVEAGPRVIAVFKGAPSIGPFKVYPAVEDYMAEHKLKISGPVIEIYEILGERKARTEYQFRFAPVN